MHIAETLPLEYGLHSAVLVAVSVQSFAADGAHYNWAVKVNIKVPGGLIVTGTDSERLQFCLACRLGAVRPTRKPLEDTEQ